VLWQGNDDDLCTQMFPSEVTDKRTETDEDAATQIIDEDVHAFTAVVEKPVDSQHGDGKLVAGGAQVNTDDLCTQVFAARAAVDHVADSNITAGAANDVGEPVDYADDLPTQVFDELSEKVEPVTDKGKKPAKGGGRAKKTGRRKVADEDLDNLATQVFDSFVPPAPPSGKTQTFQPDTVVDGCSETAVVVTSGRRTRGRMSLKASHRENTDPTVVNKAAAVASVSDANPPADDDVATQVFEADAISAVPSASSCLDNVATQVYDDVPSLSSCTGAPGIASVTEVHLAVSSGSELNSKSNTDSEDVETQVFDDVDRVVDKGNTVTSRSTKRNSVPVETGKKNSSRTGGRQIQKSIGRRKTDALAMKDVPGDEMDDLATQVFDADSHEKQSKSGKNLEPDLCHPVIDGSGTKAGKSWKSCGKPGSSSEAMAEVNDERQGEQEDEGVESVARDEMPKSRRLSSRANKGKHRAKEASLSAVPEDADDGKPKTVRSQRKGSKPANPSVLDDSLEPSSDIQPLCGDICDIGKSKTSSSTVSKDTDASKPKAARLQGKRAKLANPLVPVDSTKPPVGVEALYREVRTEASAKLTDRQRRNKKEPAQLGMPEGLTESHHEAAELVADGTDDAGVSAAGPAAADAVASKARGKLHGKKRKKLYAPKGLHTPCLKKNCRFVFVRT